MPLVPLRFLSEVRGERSPISSPISSFPPLFLTAATPSFWKGSSASSSFVLFRPPPDSPAPLARGENITSLNFFAQ